MMSAVWGKEMRSYMIILCLVLALTPVVAALEAPSVTGITPQGGANSSATAITNLAGINFTSGATVMLTPGTVAPTHKGSLSNAYLLSPRSVFVSGNYAYVVSSVSNTLEIADITNPAYPVHTGSISHGGGALLSLPFSVYVSGNYAYVASYGSNALEIVNVMNRSAPVHLSSLSNAFLVNPQSVYVSGNYAYVASHGSNMLEIVDITNPASPVHRSNIAVNTPTCVFVSGNYAYVTSSGGDSLEIVDISNPYSPVHTGSISNSYLDNPQGVYVSGNYAYIAAYDSNTLEIVDIRNPAIPVYSGRISHGGGALLSQPFSVYVSGNYAYVASSNSNALEIVDVTNPTAPVHKGYLANGGSTLLIYPVNVYVSGNYAYVASLSSNALEIVDIGTVTATGVNVVSANQITCSLNLVDKPAGPYNVVVTNPDGKFGALSNGFTISASGAPVAGFSATPRSGAVPLTVSFMDSSTNSPASWIWSFGDGTSSTEQNPVHIYSSGGVFNVSLNVTNTKGSSGLIRPDYIGVSYKANDGIAIFRPSSGYWYFDNNLDAGINTSFRYGNGADQIIRGDWQGTGRDGIAIFRPSTGYWYFDFTLEGIVDRSFRYGNGADQIIVGNWAGTQDGIAIFRPSTGYWYFDYNLEGIVDRSFRYGNGADQIIAGDWDGDGRDGIAIFRNTTGYWYFDYDLDGIVDRSFRYGGMNDRIIKGDWDGDGRDGIAIFRNTTGYWYFDYNLDGIVDKSFRYGNGADQIIAGDWQGTGREGIAIFRPSTGYWYFDNYLDGIVDKSFRYGGSTDRIIIGKWIAVAPVADFTSDVRTGAAPLTVRFTGLSNGTAPLTYIWDFNNDGVTDSTAVNPSYVYSANGTYSVNLTVTNSLGSDSELKTNFITVDPAPVAPVANFTAAPLIGFTPLTVSFTDMSTGSITSRLWEYQNATVGWTQFATSTNPSQTFPQGTYDVRLNVTGPGGSNTRTEIGYIIVNPAPVAPVADFTNTTPREGTSPLTVTFADTSTGSITSRSWEYQNATVGWTQFATSTNPSQTFPQGTYDIRLNVTGPGGSNTRTEIGYIIVNPAPVAPVADFTNTTPREGTAPLTVTFADTSTGLITSRSWEYQNATVGWTQFATSTNPSQIFPQGTYDIRLNVTGPGGSNTRTETGYIIVSPAPVAPVADFTNTTPREGTAPLTVTFADTSTGSITSRSWEYQNATVSWTQFSALENPSYEFDVGIYDIQLIVSGPGGSNTKTVTGYITVT